MVSESSASNVVQTWGGFVRYALVNEIHGHVAIRHKSLKLVGVPDMGVSGVMRCIVRMIGNGEWNRDGSDGTKKAFFAFYLDNKYGEEEFASAVLEQVSDDRQPEVRRFRGSVGEICSEAARIVREKHNGAESVFVFDNFQQNFFHYHKDKPPGYTVLTERGIEHIRGMAENPLNGIHFVVSYRYPTDALLATDWYLNNLRSVNVELLSASEADSLVESVRLLEGLPRDEPVRRRILRLGGRHPYLLDEAARTRFPDGEGYLLRFIKSRYREIRKYAADCEKRKEGEDSVTMAILRRLAGGRLDALQSGGYDLAEKYCYRDGDGGTGPWKVFSEHFAEYLCQSLPSDDGPDKPASRFDAFLSYSRKNEAAAWTIHQKLRSRGLTIWFDRKEIKPGDSFMEMMLEGLKTSACLILLIGREPLGDWTREEALAAVKRAVERKDKRIIPVLLPGVDEIPDDFFYVGRVRCVCFKSDSLDEEHVYADICNAIRPMATESA